MKPHLFFLCALAAVLPYTAVRSSENELTQELADRYEQMLIRSPQPGAAFDKVIEWYSTQGGGLEALSKRWQEAAGANADQRGAYLIGLGLLAERQNRADQARNFYREAMNSPSGDPIPAARQLIALERSEGDFAAAAAVTEKALTAKTLAPVDRLELLRSLAMIHQRSFQDEKAIEVWKRAVAEFPDDPYVLEEAGEAFLSASSYDEARKAFQTLRERSQRDPYRKVTASLRLAKVEELAGNMEEAVAIYDIALSETSEGSWLNREVRSRLEELFRRKDDLPGLLAYYEKRTEAFPQDFTAVAAKASVLADLGRSGESLAAIRKAVELAPTDMALRMTLIQTLTTSGLLAEALEEASTLAKPGNAPVEVLLVLGNLQWQQFESSGSDSDKEAAIATWRRIAPDETQDAAAIAQLAEIFVARGMEDQAIAEWKRLIVVSPAAVDARQKLAAVYVKRGDRAAAEQVVNDLVTAERSGPENFLSQAKLQQNLEWKPESRATIDKALQAFPDNHDLLGFAWRQALEDAQGDRLEALFPRYWSNAPSEFFAEDTVKSYAQFLSSTETPNETLASQRQKAQDPAAGPERSLVWLQLAIALKDQPEASAALASVVEKQTPLRVAQAKLVFAQAFQSEKESITALREVIQADPRLSVEALNAIVGLQAQLGNYDEALQTLDQIIEKSPADASSYLRYADLAAQAGKWGVATERLKQALRHVEDANVIRLRLSSFLQSQGRNSEAQTVLAEAFENEKTEGRRMEIFRQQVQMALQLGQIDDLIESLREKQAKEQDGARYGVYLAEIYMSQNDFLSAREELARSLGRNPDNPEAVKKLMELSENGGDMEEAIRLARRLAEIQPSIENRSTLLARLMQAGETQEAVTMLEKVKPEILRDPSAWNDVLQVMQASAYKKQFLTLLDEIIQSSDDPKAVAQLAMLLIVQGRYAEAEDLLWKRVKREGLSDAITATLAAPINPAFGNSTQNLSNVFNQARNDLRMAFQSQFTYGRAFSRRMWMNPTPAANIPPEQLAQLQSLSLLQALAEARLSKPAFETKLRETLSQLNVSRDAQFSLGMSLNASDLIAETIRSQAQDSHPDLSLDKRILDFFPDPESTAFTKDLQTIQERVEQQDQGRAFQRQLSQFSRDFASTPQPHQRTPEFDRQFRLLLEHPGRTEDSRSALILANLALTYGDADVAFDLLAKLPNTEPSSPQEAATQQSLWSRVVFSGIKANDPRIDPYFEKVFSDQSHLANQGTQAFLYSGRVLRRSMMPSPLAAKSTDLAVGDKEFPVVLYQNIFGRQNNGGGGYEWFKSRAKGSGLDRYTLGYIYSLWFSGNRDEALKFVETLNEKEPSPRTAALLLEMYEKVKKPEKALALIDDAALQSMETIDLRSLRKVRLLKEAGQVDAAKELLGKLAGGRLTPSLTGVVSAELQELGMAQDKYPRLSRNQSMPSRQPNRRSTTISENVSKLFSDGKDDAAKKMAYARLLAPLPDIRNYNEMNLRRNLIQSLSSRNALDEMQSILHERLVKNPADGDAALRLMELASDEQSSAAISRVMKIAKEHPDHGMNPDAVMGLLQMRGRRSGGMEILYTMLSSNPEAFGTSLTTMQTMMSLSENAQNQEQLASVISGLSDEDYRSLFLPSSLSGQMNEQSMILQLAEVAKGSGKPEDAVRLLQRVVDGRDASQGSNLEVVLRLAEIQLELGKNAEASQTMKGLIFSQRGQRIHQLSGVSQLNSQLMSQMMNARPRGEKVGVIERFGELAKKTGLLEETLAELDKLKQPMAVVTPALMIRTHFKMPGIEKDWAEIVDGSEAVGPVLNLSLMGTVVKVLAGQEQGEEKILKLLEKNTSKSPNSMGYDVMSYLIQVVPVFGTFRDQKAVNEHLDQMINQVATGQMQNLPLYDTFPAVMFALIDAGYVKPAQRLFDVGKTSLSARMQLPEYMEAIEQRLKEARGGTGELQAICAGQPVGPGKMVVHWSFTPKKERASNNGSSREGIAWNAFRGKFTEKDQPAVLEIFAGPNPANLKKVSEVAKPQGQGKVEISLPPGLGLLQTKWKMPDGNWRWGQLTAYVLGQNLLPPDGLPDMKDFPGTTGSPTEKSPWGGKTAVLVDYIATAQSLVWPFGNIPVENSAQAYVFVGWLKGSAIHGTAAELLFNWQGKGENRRSPENVYVQVPYGEWRQIIRMWGRNSRGIEGNSLPEETTSVTMEMRVQAWGSRGPGQFQIQAAWDGLQLVAIGKGEMPASEEEVGKKFEDALGKKEISQAIELFHQAFKIAPHRFLQRNGERIFKLFSEADKMDELYRSLAVPALYTPDPLMRFQPVMRSGPLLSPLIKGAMAVDASAAAKQWLKVINEAPLSPEMRYLVEASLLNQKLASSKDVSEGQIFEVLGWSEKEPDLNRIALIWSSRETGDVTTDIISQAKKQFTGDQLVKMLGERSVPPDYQLAKLQLEARLLVDSKPEEALARWKDGVYLAKNGPNLVSISDDLNRSFLTELAATEVPTGDFIAAAREWQQSRYYSPEDVDRNMVEFLYGIATVDSPRQKEYLKQWKEAEIVALKIPRYNPSRDRLRRLVTLLQEEGEWERLDEVIKSPSIDKPSQAAFNSEFAQLRALIDLSQGVLDGAWPIAWCAAGAKPTEATLHWQWEPKNFSHERGRYDATISLSEEGKALPIRGQTSVELEFGEMPGTMETIATVEGETSRGETKVTLPHANGFLRAVAVVDGKRIPGPLGVIVSGKPVFPTPGTSLRSFLQNGSTPLSETMLKEVGVAPDGSPAVEVGQAREGNTSFPFAGDEYALTPGKFYVSRAWLQRGGSGAAYCSNELKAKEGSTRKPLAMILTDGEESPNRWTFFTRAVPVLPEHSFWIPYEEVATVTPRLDVRGGSKVANWELIDVEGWKYAEWIQELALLRKKVEDQPTPEQVQRIAELAAIEPLTALDYHGSWVVDRMVAGGLNTQVADLYRTALIAEANPLFARPKLGRIVGSLTKLLDHPDYPVALKYDLITYALDHPERLNLNQVLALQRRYLEVAAQTGHLPQATETVRKKLGEHLSTKGETSATFLAEALGARSYQKDQPICELLTICNLLQDETLTKAAGDILKKDQVAGLDNAKHRFARMAFASPLPDENALEPWLNELDRAFLSTEKGTAPEDFMFWPNLLGNQLQTRGASPAAVYEVRKRAFDRILQSNRKQSSEMRELARTGGSLLAASLSQKDDVTTAKCIEEMSQKFAANPTEVGDDTLGIILASLDRLHEDGKSELSSKLFESVRPRVERTSKMKEAYARYLATATSEP